MPSTCRGLVLLRAHEYRLSHNKTHGGFYIRVQDGKFSNIEQAYFNSTNLQNQVGHDEFVGPMK